jgi:dCMP deaminase
MKSKFISLYMKMADQVSLLSHAVRRNVGAVIVNDGICVFGYNGMPSGWSNTCENKIYVSSTAGGQFDESDLEYWPMLDDVGRYRLKTKPEVLHAEMNALAKISKTTVSSQAASLFVTCAPCIDCAKAIYQAGICEVFYKDDYRSSDGIDFLKKCNIPVTQVMIDSTSNLI